MTGFKSGAAVCAKAAVKIAPVRIPPRSPDLNPCDYALWLEISKRMRQQELKWKNTRPETRDEYLRRLRRTAIRVPKSFIHDSVVGMARWCSRLDEAKGGHFEEGGTSK